jgi:glucokinase
LGKKANKGKRGTIGIDVGGTKTLYALFDEDFEVLAEEKLRSHPRKGGLAAFEHDMEKAVGQLLREAKKRKLRVSAVGVGCAGQIDMRKGSVRRAPNLTFLEGYNFRKPLEKLTKASVFVANDVHTALYGEHQLGAARKSRHVIGVFLGTGVGGALIIDNRLHLGAGGDAGDIGNYLLHTVDTSLEAPRKEVLDSVASRPAIVGDAAALASRHYSSKLRKLAGTDVREITSGDLARAIRKGDKSVETLVRSRAAVVGTALSNLVDFINPDMVVLGGGLVSSMPTLLRREIARTVKAHASPKAAKAVEVVVAEFGDHAGTVGAAKLALDMLSRDPPIRL